MHGDQPLDRQGRRSACGSDHGAGSRWADRRVRSSAACWEVSAIGPGLLEELEQSSGWDGYFIWDHLIYWDPEAELVDPWVALTAMALATQRIRIGVLVAALPRRRPWVVARQAATIDRLSNGRLVFGAGLGSMPDEYLRFGEHAANQARASKLDEALEILAALWSGRPVSHEGDHFRLQDVRMLPPPVQRPRIPIWIGGKWPHRGPFRRAARWDGVMPTHVDYGHGKTMPPEDLAEVVGFVAGGRRDDRAFDVALEGESPSGDGWNVVQPYAEAGLTWWVEKRGWWRGPLPETRARISRVRQVPHADRDRVQPNSRCIDGSAGRATAVRLCPLSRAMISAMNIFLCASRSAYGRVGQVRDHLEHRGHAVTLPNNFDDPGREDAIKNSGMPGYARWKAEMLALQASKVAANDAVLVLNLDKDGQQNHLGGATFLEVFKAWELGKRIYLYNPIPQNVLRDELIAMEPTVIEGKLDRVA